ncbi:MAG: DHA1 family bicyclomycin/chloramphenicol resistance-like MFS transporter, partial [Gammaproteobacteria bacterium]
MASALTSVSIDMLAPILPVLSAAFSDSTGSTKMTIHAFYVGFGFAHLFWGSLSDHFGRRKIMLIGICIYALATFGCISASDLDHLLFFRSLQGLGAAVGMIIGRAVIRDIYGPERSTQAVATMFLLFVPIPMVVPLLSGYVVSHFNWPSIFWIMEIFSISIFAIIFFLLMETAPSKAKNINYFSSYIKDLTVVLGNRFFLGTAFTNMFAFAAFVVFISHFPHIMTSKFEFTPQQNGLLLSMISISLAVGVFSVRKLVPKIGVKHTVMMGIFLMLGFWIIILILQMLDIQILSFYIAPLCIASFSGGVILCLLPGQAMVPFSNNAGAASSVFGIFQYGGSAALGYLSGAFYDNTPLT